MVDVVSVACTGRPHPTGTQKQPLCAGRASCTARSKRELLCPTRRVVAQCRGRVFLRTATQRYWDARAHVELGELDFQPAHGTGERDLCARCLWRDSPPDGVAPLP